MSGETTYSESSEGHVTELSPANPFKRTNPKARSNSPVDDQLRHHSPGLEKGPLSPPLFDLFSFKPMRFDVS